MRPLFTDLTSTSCQFGVLQNYDGSALFKTGGCCAVCGVHVACPVTQHKELVNRCQVEVTFSTIHDESDVCDRAVEELVRNVVEAAVLVSQYPATMISVSLHLLNRKPIQNMLSVCVNATSLALLDSSISMRFVPVAVSCFLSSSSSRSSGGQSAAESVSQPVTESLQSEAERAAEVTVVYAGTCGRVVAVYGGGGGGAGGACGDEVWREPVQNGAAAAVGAIHNMFRNKMALKFGHHLATPSTVGVCGSGSEVGRMCFPASGKTEQH